MKGRERKNKENKEKKQKQILIQFFKDSVNNRYEINYHTAQPRYFVRYFVSVFPQKNAVFY